MAALALDLIFLPATHLHVYGNMGSENRIQGRRHVLQVGRPRIDWCPYKVDKNSARVPRIFRQHFFFVVVG